MNQQLTATLPLPFNEAVEITKQKLAEQGFGIITEIDVTATLKKKLDVDFKNYLILGACNPGFAHRAIQADDNVGLLLPCNVIVYETQKGVTITTLKPTHALSLLGNKEVCKVGEEAETILINVFENLNNLL